MSWYNTQINWSTNCNSSQVKRKNRIEWTKANSVLVGGEFDNIEMTMYVKINCIHPPHMKVNDIAIDHVHTFQSSKLWIVILNPKVNTHTFIQDAFSSNPRSPVNSNTESLVITPQLISIPSTNWPEAVVYSWQLQWSAPGGNQITCINSKPRKYTCTYEHLPLHRLHIPGGSSSIKSPSCHL